MMRPGPPCLGVSGLPAFAEASVDRGVSGPGSGWRMAGMEDRVIELNWSFTANHIRDSRRPALRCE
jgi:hypothetical protein